MLTQLTRGMRTTTRGSDLGTPSRPSEAIRVGCVHFLQINGLKESLLVGPDASLVRVCQSLLRSVRTCLRRQDSLGSTRVFRITTTRRDERMESLWA